MSATGGGATEPEWRRRERLARIFGDALPDTTSDERDDAERGATSGASADASGGSAERREEWLRRQVPPHHGD